MNHNTTEMREVAQAAVPAPRPNLYAGIHKAMRALMADTLLGVGRMDVDDDLEFARTCQRVIELLDACANHLKHENDFLHPAIEARAPGQSGQIAGEHLEHQRDIAEFSHAVAVLLACPRAQRAMATHAFYLRLSVFVGHNFEHMHYEETAHNAALWAHWSDAELMDLEGRLVASIPPEEMMGHLRWMLPFMNPAERLELLGGMQAHAPAPAFQAALDVARPHLTAQEWAKLERGLGLAA